MSVHKARSPCKCAPVHSHALVHIAVSLHLADLFCPAGHPCSSNAEMHMGVGDADSRRGRAMRIEVAMFGSSGDEIVCVARPVTLGTCPLLGPVLHKKVRGLVAGMAVVLI